MLLASHQVEGVQEQMLGGEEHRSDKHTDGPLSTCWTSALAITIDYLLRG